MSTDRVTELIQLVNLLLAALDAGDDAAILDALERLDAAAKPARPGLEAAVL